MKLRRIAVRAGTFSIAFTFLICANAAAHDGPHDHSHASPATRQWNLSSGDTQFYGSFVSTTDGKVAIHLRNGRLVTLKIRDLSGLDQEWIEKRQQAIVELNQSVKYAARPSQHSIGHEEQPAIAEHFQKYVDAKSIKTRWDDDFFFVESKGMPNHKMMIGITAWQQQIPIPQNYTGDNAWRIPLKPVPAARPMSTKTNFFRGAIALAVNGVPIFNPIKNDGKTDTNLAGELDEFGGHCGRVDDYHYHLPPVHLEKVVGEGKPIAYALDGYPILGYQSKEEAEKSKLDQLNGHKDEKGNYHYHSTKAYPYLNGGFYGKVVERGGQVDPQPRASGIRPALRGLRGAKITGFNKSKNGKSVSVEYTLGNETRSVSYTTEDFQTYEFSFDNGRQGKSSETYSVRPDRRGRRGQGVRRNRGGRQDAERGRGGNDSLGRDQDRKKRGPQPGDGPRQPWIVVHADEIDLNGDKIISRDEMIGESEKAFDGYDKDSDGKLTATELLGRGNSRSAMGGFLRGHAKEIDRDGDGVLTREEAVGNARRMFAKMDRNQDGKIDAKELKSAKRTEENAKADQERRRGSKQKQGDARNRDGMPRRYSKQEESNRGGERRRQRQNNRQRGTKNQGGSRLGGYETPPPANNVPKRDFDILLGRPTDKSITVSVLLLNDADMFISYGRSLENLSNETKPYQAKAGTPVEINIDGLEPNESYSYQLNYRPLGKTKAQVSRIYAFHTQRSPQNSFRFTVQADSHLDENTSADVYMTTLRNALRDGSDFHVALGDTFMTGKYVRPELAEPQYLAQRYYLGSLCHSTPLFFCLGNHDGESSKGRKVKNKNRTGNREREGKVDAKDSTRIWSVNTRKKYFPNPFPDLNETKAFYSGNESIVENVGQVEDYYAWQWGNSLFVVLDPFWYSGGRSRTEGNHWHQTLGDEQYNWLVKTLHNSDAKFKFVFIHHLVGGADRNNRGGVSSAPYFEWGGNELDGTDTFSKNRPNWKLPIHDLLVKNDVSIVFHGHDHLYAKEELDGIVYQAVPQPGHPRFGNVRSAEEYGYHGEVISSSGHLRVSVSADSARVDYIRAYLPKDESGRRKNGEIGTSYLIE